MVVAPRKVRAACKLYIGKLYYIFIYHLLYKSIYLFAVIEWVECDERLRFDLPEFKAGEGVLESTLVMMREPGAGGPGM